jgi:hypothetical protein
VVRNKLKSLNPELMAIFIQHRFCDFVLPTTDSTTANAARSVREAGRSRQSLFRGTSQKNWNLTNNYKEFVEKNCLSANFRIEKWSQHKGKLFINDPFT